MSKTTGLGKGLNAIFDIENMSATSSQRTFQSSSIISLPIESIKPNPTQPRTVFETTALEELSQSIARPGVIQPITVKEVEVGKYTIISGERRYRASIMAGLTTIPAYIKPTGNESVLEMALVENIQREDLGAMEIAVTMQRLVDECNLTQEQLADRIGKKRSTVANYLRLLKLPAEIQFALREELITMGHARALISLDKPQQQIKLLARIIDSALSVRQVEELVKQRLNPKPKTASEEREYPQSYTMLLEKLEGIMGQNISIKRNADGKGKIVIDFAGDSDIEKILERLN